MAPTYTTAMYRPIRVGDTLSDCAIAGAMAGTVSTAMDTSAWIASVAASTLHAPEGSRDIRAS